jgi:hypothetical protein
MTREGNVAALLPRTSSTPCHLCNRCGGYHRGNPPDREEKPLVEEDFGNDSDGLWCSPPRCPQSNLAGALPSAMAASR